MACAGVWGKFMACYLASHVSVEHTIGWTPYYGQRLLSWIQNVRRRGIAASTFSQMLQSVRRRRHELRAEVVVIQQWRYAYFFLGAFEILWKTRISCVMSCLCPSVRPPARMEQRGSHSTDFHEIWYLIIFAKFSRNFKFALSSDKNDGHFTWRPLYIYDTASLSSFLWWCMFQTEVVEKIKTYIMFYIYIYVYISPENHAVYEIMWKKMIEPDRQQMKI